MSGPTTEQRTSIETGPSKPSEEGGPSHTPRPLARTITFLRLTWFDMVRLCRSPVLLLGTGISVLLTLDTSWRQSLPTLESWYSNATSLSTVMGVTMFVAVTFPAMREVRYSTETVVPMGPAGRLLALMAASTLTGTVLVAGLTGPGLWPSSPPLAGTLSPFAYPLPLLLTAVGSLVSITLVAWTRSYLSPAVAVLVLPAYWLYGFAAAEGGLSSAVHTMQWAFQVTLHPFTVDAPSVTDVAAHYLAYTIMVALFLAFLGLAARGGRTLRLACLATAVVLLAGAVGTVVHGRRTQPLHTPIPDSRVHGAREGSPCEVRDGITYCPLPGFEPWVEHWHASLGPAMAFLPEEAADRLPVVWQDAFSYQRELDVPEDRAVVVYGYMTPEWRYGNSDMVARAARLALDLPDPHEAGMCRATDQARMVLTAWLATTDEGLSRHDELNILLENMYPYAPSPVDLEVARALLDTPEERTALVLEQHWERLSGPRGSSTELAELSGIELRETSTLSARYEDWKRLYPELEHEPFLVGSEWTRRPTCR